MGECLSGFLLLDFINSTMMDDDDDDIDNLDDIESNKDGNWH